MNKLPPIEKIHEAFTAIADGRVTLHEDSAAVVSSGGNRQYAVHWDGDTYTSNDNASYWQLYPGYPIIAVLMLQDRLHVSMETVKLFAGINWRALNAAHKRNYARAAAEVMARLRDRGVNTVPIDREILRLYDALGKLGITVKRSAVRPPK